MNVRHKTFAIFFVCCAAPLVLLCVFYYLMATRAIEAQMNVDTQRAASILAERIEAALDEREKDLSALAQSQAVRSFVLRNQSQTSGKSNSNIQPASNVSPTDTLVSNRVSALQSNDAATTAVPEEVRHDVLMFMRFTSMSFAALACVKRDSQPLFRAAPEDHAGNLSEEAALRFQTTAFPSNSVRGDERVWTTMPDTLVRSPVMHDASGALVRYTIGINSSDEHAMNPVAALIADLKLDGLLRHVLEASAGKRAGLANMPSRTSAALFSNETNAPRLLLVLNRTGQIFYHTNDALRHQSIERAMPTFSPVAEAMQRDANGWRFFDDADGAKWLAAFHSVPALDSSLAVAEDYSAATVDLRRTLWLSTAFSLAAALVAALLLVRFIGRTKGSIERVTENAVAIAEGNLDGRIEVRSSDDMRLMADTFNQMTKRLREQLAREAETRQFESFMRLSAMLTHDLKNAIASLSLIVRNMERQFHRAEFRADAMQSLTDATDKLRALVAKLSEPMRSLSGEFPAPRPTNLIPALRRVLAANTEPSSGLYEIETQLPATLVATVDAERMEKVIENLVLNALEAMGARGGKLIVEGGAENEREIFFSIADTGAGMSEEFQNTKLFHAFATTKKKGVGLGLYTCREIVKAHGGRIEVQSKKGAGTCFRVVLPSPDATAKNAVAATKA